METFIFVLNVIGAIAFASSGAIVAIEKKMDIFGVTVLGITTAVGGGFIRDITLGNVPPETFKNPIFALIAISMSIILFIPKIRKLIIKSRKIYDLVMFIMDSVGLGVFTTLGVTYCLESGFDGFFLNLFVGVVTGVGGGVIRDVFAGDTPYIFKKHIYACASAVGAIVTYCLYNSYGYVAAIISGFTAIILIRCFSAYFKWNLPTAK